MHMCATACRRPYCMDFGTKPNQSRGCLQDRLIGCDCHTMLAAKHLGKATCQRSAEHVLVVMSAAPTDALDHGMIGESQQIHFLFSSPLSKF